MREALSGVVLPAPAPSVITGHAERDRPCCCCRLHPTRDGMACRLKDDGDTHLVYFALVYGCDKKNCLCPVHNSDKRTFEVDCKLQKAPPRNHVLDEV